MNTNLGQSVYFYCGHIPYTETDSTHCFEIGDTFNPGPPFRWIFYTSLFPSPNSNSIMIMGIFKELRSKPHPGTYKSRHGTHKINPGTHKINLGTQKTSRNPPDTYSSLDPSNPP